MLTSSRLAVLEDGCDKEKMKKIAVDDSAMIETMVMMVTMVMMLVLEF